MKRAWIIALLLAGCTPPDIHPQLTPTPAPAMGLSGPQAPAIASDWWTAFGDPQLDRIVNDALSGSPTLDQALARVRQASAAVQAADAATQPQATLDANEVYQRLPGRYIIPPPYGGSLRFVGAAAANLSYDLDLFGRQRASIRQAQASAQAARLDAAAGRQALAGSVASTYLELVRAERLIQVAQGSVAVRDRYLRLTNVRIRNQLSSQLDARAAETLVAQARQALVRAQAARIVTIHALAALAGRGADYYPTIGATTLRLSAPLPLPATLPVDLLGRRADLLAAQARIDAAAAGRQVARRAYYPNISLTGLLGVQAIGLGNLLAPASIAAGIGPALHLPLFDGGRLRADLTSATAAQDVAIADYNEQVVRAVRDAADALARIAATDADRARQREVVRGLSETGRLNAVRVNSGLESRLDLVDTDLRLLAAQQDAASLDVDAALRRVDLVLALGGGFTPDEVQP